MGLIRETIRLVTLKETYVPFLMSTTKQIKDMTLGENNFISLFRMASRPVFWTCLVLIILALVLVEADKQQQEITFTASKKS